MDRKLEIILAAKDMTARALTSVNGRIQKLSKQVFSLHGVFAGAAAAAGMGYFIKQSIEVADNIGKTADKLGITTSALQEYRYAASQAGVQQTVLDMGMQRFTRRVAEAAQGQGELKSTLELYGIAVKDANGKTRQTEDVLADLADVIARTESGSERLRITFKAFDSEGAVMVNMFKKGSAGLNQFRQDARDLGIVMDDRLIKASGQANDELDTLCRIIKTQVISAVVELAPDIAELTEKITQSSGKIKDYASNIFSVAKAAMEAARAVAWFFDATGKGLGITAGKMLYGPDSAVGQIDKTIAAVKLKIMDLKREIDEAFDEQQVGEFMGGIDVGVLESQLDRLQKKLTNLITARNNLIRQAPASTPKGLPAVPVAGGAKGGPLADVLPDMTHELGMINYELEMFRKQSMDAWADWDITHKLKEASIAAQSFVADIRHIEPPDPDKYWQWIQAGEIAINNMEIEVETAVSGIKEAAEKTFGQDLANAVEGWASGFSGTLTDMVWDAEMKFGNIAESFGRMLTQMAIQKMIVEPLVGGFTGFLSGLFHEGGVVGKTPVSAQFMPASAFAHAPRLHSGLAGDEFPAILQRGETVIPKGSGGGTPNIQVNIINHSSQQLQGRQRGGPRFDGKKWVIDVVIDSINRRGPMFGAIQGMRL